MQEKGNSKGGERRIVSEKIRRLERRLESGEKEECNNKGCGS